MKFLSLFILFLITTISYGAEPMTGTSVAGLPSVSFSSGEGFEYGARLYLYQYGDGSISPFKWNLVTNFSQTTEQRRDVFLFLDIPRIIGRDSRFDIYFDHKKFTYDDYFGVGNNNVYDKDLKDDTSPQFIDEHYYNYKRRWFAVLAKLQFPLHVPGLKGLAGFGFYDTEIAPQSGVTLFEQQNPYGAYGGLTNYLQTGVVYDSRDSESVPGKGFWTEVLLEKTIKALGSDYHFWRFTLTDRRYFRLHPRVVYAQRIMYEAMPGSPPFYEMSFFSSSYQRREGLGGGYSMRGIPRFLLLGPDKLLGNFELRIRSVHKRIWKQDFTSYLHLFVDAGRVWTVDDEKNLSHLHYSRGFGLHVKWNKDFVGALDVGFSKYKSMAIYATFGNLF